MGRLAWDDAWRGSTARDEQPAHPGHTCRAPQCSQQCLAAQGHPHPKIPLLLPRGDEASRSFEHRVTPEHHLCLQARLHPELAGVPVSRHDVRMSSLASPHTGHVWDFL